MVTTPSQPNSDWHIAESYWQTTLDADLFHILSKTSSQSSFVKHTFCRYPVLCAEFLAWQAKANEEAFKAELVCFFSSFSQDMDLTLEVEASRALRVFRRCQTAALAVLELADRLSIDASCFRISAIADLMIKKSYDCSVSILENRFGRVLDERDQQQNLLILAMGKLGGNELNFSSDIDLIFFYPQAGSSKGGAREVDAARYFQKIATMVIKLLDEVTEEGFVYRVDMRLRPYGDSGALVMTLEQAEDYYQEQGREWERFAMVRARVLTGSTDERQSLENIITPFCFRRYIDYGVIDSIRNMKSMIVREVRRKGLKDNIKLGAGGIREIEFIVQALQLIQGGRDKRLTERSILKVLPNIVLAKLLPADVAESLAKAYRFLRRVEHCIQELNEKQTQQLPEAEAEQVIIAEAMGYSDWPAFYKALSDVQQSVHKHFEELLGEERHKGLEQDEFYKALSEGHVSVAQLCEHKGAGNQRLSPESAEQFIEFLDRFLSSTSINNLSSRGLERFKVFFPSLLSTCLNAAEPPVALSRSLTIIQSILKRTAYLDLLSENPPILEHLVDLASKSEWIVKRLSEHPILFDELLYPNSLYAPLQTADLESELRQSLLRANTEDEEDILDSLRAFKQTNELRVAAALLAERLSISQVSRYLTQLAQVVLESAIKLSWKLVTKRHGRPSNLKQGDYGFAVIGYGKLGGMELGFGSDLDLVFLFDQSVDETTDGDRPLNNSRFYTRLAQKLIHLLSTRTNLGLLYEVDMRLRPSGSSGLLVSHIDSYYDYQMESAWTWEHQALVRARLVAGDNNLLPRFEQVRNKTLNQVRDLSKLKSDVKEMRDKMRDQLEKKKQGFIDLKQSKGGLVDIEFMAQFLCLSYGGVKTIPFNTVDCLKFSQDQKLIDKESALTLIKSYRTFRNRLNEQALMEKGRLVDESEFLSHTDKVSQVWHQLLS